MAKIKEIDGHNYCFLPMACSPYKSTVISAAADKTLRFWDVFVLPGNSSIKCDTTDPKGGTKSKKLSRIMHIF